MRARIITPKKANRLSRARQANGNASRRLKRTRNGSAPTMPPVTHYFGQRHNTAGIFWTTTKTTTATSTRTAAQASVEARLGSGWVATVPP